MHNSNLYTFIDLPKLKTKQMSRRTLSNIYLNQGMYINGTYNEFYVKGKKAYQQYNFNHDYVIFGYDDDLFHFF